MKDKLKTLYIQSKPPKTVHNKYLNGQLVYTNQIPDEKMLKINVHYEVTSENWWPAQHVTDRNGNVWQTDVFQYGQYYVILMTDGSKIQVIHNHTNQWNYA